MHSPGRMVGHSSWQVQHHLAKQRILIENPLAVKVGQKNDLSIAPITNFKYLQMYCLSERSSKLLILYTCKHIFGDYLVVYNFTNSPFDRMHSMKSISCRRFQRKKFDKLTLFNKHFSWLTRHWTNHCYYIFSQEATGSLKEDYVK